MSLKLKNVIFVHVKCAFYYDKASRSPSIVGQTIEEHTFSLNETEKILECVSSAEPTSKIKWTRDDKVSESHKQKYNHINS